MVWWLSWSSGLLATLIPAHCHLPNDSMLTVKETKSDLVTVGFNDQGQVVFCRVLTPGE